MTCLLFCFLHVLTTSGLCTNDLLSTKERPTLWATGIVKDLFMRDPATMFPRYAPSECTAPAPRNLQRIIQAVTDRHSEALKERVPSLSLVELGEAVRNSNLHCGNTGFSDAVLSACIAVPSQKFLLLWRVRIRPCLQRQNGECTANLIHWKGQDLQPDPGETISKESAEASPSGLRPEGTYISCCI